MKLDSSKKNIKTKNNKSTKKFSFVDIEINFFMTKPNPSAQLFFGCLLLDFLLLSLPFFFQVFDTNSDYKLGLFALQSLVHCLAFYFLLKSIDSPKKEKHRLLICALVLICIVLAGASRLVVLDETFSQILTKLYHKLRGPLLFVLAIPFYVSRKKLS